LGESLERLGGQLIVRRTSDAPEEVLRVAHEVDAGCIYFNEDYLPYPLQRDQRVQSLAEAQRRVVKSYTDTLLVHPQNIKTEQDNPYSVFTPFKRRWSSLVTVSEPYPIEPLLSHLRVPMRIPSHSLPSLSDFGLTLTQSLPPVGEENALRKLKQFVSTGMPAYHQKRDFAADPDGTSRLSVYLKWGSLSIRDCYREAKALGGDGAEKWIDELAWREFCYAVAYHFPYVLEGNMRSEYDAFEWDSNPHRLSAWKEGLTGYPFVDAGMRQLNATGWMHNRLRQVTASYLCKNLCIHWQEGERYFMQQLVDGDWACNNGGWQWVAGTGTDPRRATRIFNPVLQQEKYDPDFEYIRQWVPEYGTSRYPKPIVLHEDGRDEYLRRYQAMKTVLKPEEVLYLFFTRC